MHPPLFMRPLVVMCPLIAIKTSCVCTFTTTKLGYGPLDGFP
jgi:hypothetical protein